MNLVLADDYEPSRERAFGQLARSSGWTAESDRRPQFLISPLRYENG
jgi:hypothetical protein